VVLSGGQTVEAEVGRVADTDQGIESAPDIRDSQTFVKPSNLDGSAIEVHRHD
jgi:hypothetical protein